MREERRQCEDVFRLGVRLLEQRADRFRSLAWLQSQFMPVEDESQVNVILSAEYPGAGAQENRDQRGDSPGNARSKQHRRRFGCPLK